MVEKNLQNQEIEWPSETQRRIIEAAVDIFADRGYRYATIRDICDRASVNVAAINYHFGGKKNLYISVLKYWQARAFEKYPFPADLDSLTPRLRLAAFVKTLIYRVLDEGEGSRFANLMAYEFIQPTAGLDVIVEETLRPMYVFFSQTVRQLFPVLPDEETINLCCISVVGQVFHLFMGRHVMRRLLGRESLDKNEIGRVADHIVRFSLYAIEAIAAHREGEDE